MLVQKPEIVNTILMFLLIVLVLFVLGLSFNNYNKKMKNNNLEKATLSSKNVNNVNLNNVNNVSPNSLGSKGNQIENFLAYPDQQKFCPNIFNSMSSFWTEFPKKYSNGLLGKFCCTSCYYKVSKSIYCGQNSIGDYKLCTLKIEDINELEKYHEEQDIDFDFPDLTSHIGKNVLKMKMNDIYYPIQIIKTLDELNEHEEDPTLANQLYKDTYEC